MIQNQNRLNRERFTIQIMVEIYCREHHHPAKTMCSECRELLTYAMQRIDKCPLRSGKPSCAKCPIHCYKADKREQVRRVMRFSGPRMILYHPILAIQYLWDEVSHPVKKK